MVAVGCKLQSNTQLLLSAAELLAQKRTKSKSHNKLKYADKLDNVQSARCKETLLAREMLVL